VGISARYPGEARSQAPYFMFLKNFRGSTGFVYRTSRPLRKIVGFLLVLSIFIRNSQRKFWSKFLEQILYLTLVVEVSHSENNGENNGEGGQGVGLW